jgi:putative ABC transport system ATP-binding protein
VSTAIVELSQVNRIFPGVPPYHALHDVDLRIEAGEYLSLVGPSGAGKSTMLNLLGLMDRPTTGEYWMDGAPPRRPRKTIVRFSEPPRSASSFKGFI